MDITILSRWRSDACACDNVEFQAFGNIYRGVCIDETIVVMYNDDSKRFRHGLLEYTKIPAILKAFGCGDEEISVPYYPTFTVLALAVARHANSLNDFARWQKLQKVAYHLLFS